jgi:meso-butanediol dehydrogenase/(S,S)-butanediol dehydrogenase/diacetyl reductase
LQNQAIALDRRVALVTGGSRGIGRGIAESLLGHGARVVIGDVAVPPLDPTSPRQSTPLETLHLDVRDRDSVTAAVDQIERETGPIDILVNNAGVLSLAPALELTEAEWDRIMDVNAKGTFLCSQIVGRRMAGRGYGRIVNISSIAGKVPLPDQVHYCASKAAVLAITRVFAVELAPSGITVNAVCPGAIDTPLFEACYTWTAERAGVPPQTVREEWVSGIPIGRLIDPAEIGPLVAFLASDAAAAITGQAYNIDGGRVAW